MKTLTLNQTEMMKAKITSALILIICLFTFSVMAQGPGQGNGQGNGQNNPNSGGNGHTPLVVCLNGNTLTVDQNALHGMMQAGATLGPCVTPPQENDDQINDDQSNDDEGSNDNDVIIDPPSLPGCYAIQVIDYKPAKRNDGTDIPAARRIAERALGAPQNSDAAVSESQANFVALGFGGSITLRMAGPIKNGEGNDFKVFETTYGSMSGNCNRYPERVKAFASQDGCNWIYLGEKCQDAEFDLGPLNWAEYIRLVDASPVGAAYNNSVADGYDVDGIACLHGFEENPVMQDFGNQYATEVVSFNQGLRKNGTSVAANRSNPAQALGAPDFSDIINFVSLGFGGNITLKFGYVIFDKDGDDLQIVETSFGNPSCNQYPEGALIEASLDGVNFTEIGEICLDGNVDFATGGVKFAQYIRIHDRSNATRFGGTADGYDVDGVVVINAGCVNEETSNRIVDDVWTADETFGVNIYPNPFINNVNVEMLNTTEGQINISVMTYTGQVMSKHTVNAGNNEVFVQNIELSHLTAGIYIIRVESNNSIETHKLIKQ
ncbi:MAG: T9SS type A sorting domain-containing protein [Flavobacteriales bacterium]